MYRCKFYAVVLFMVAWFIQAGCNGRSDWTQDQQDAFYDQCFSGTVNSFDPVMAENYCNCMLETIMKKYPDPESIDNITMEEMYSYAGDCFH